MWFGGKYSYLMKTDDTPSALKFKFFKLISYALFFILFCFSGQWVKMAWNVDNVFTHKVGLLQVTWRLHMCIWMINSMSQHVKK